MNPFRNDIRMLLVDDEEALLDLEAEYLERYLDSPEITTTTSPEEALNILDGGEIDAVVSDYQMPEMTGQDLLEEVRHDYPELPFILFTGQGSEEVASDAISSGVTDYLQKDPSPSIYEVLSNRVKNAVRERREGEMSQIFKTAVDEIDENVVVTDVDGDIVYVNNVFSDFTGYSLDEALGENPRILKSGENDDEMYEELWDTILDGEIWSGEMVNEKKDGSSYSIDQKIVPSTYGSETYFVAVNMPRE